MLLRQQMLPVRIEDSVAYHIYRCQRLLRRHLLALASRAGLSLTPEQWFVLNKLHHQPRQSQVELSEAIFADRPNMTRILATMERNGWLERFADPEDGRRSLVALTAEGELLHQKMAALVPEARAQVFEEISDKELQAVMVVLAKIEKNVGALL